MLRLLAVAAAYIPEYARLPKATEVVKGYTVSYPLSTDRTCESGEIYPVFAYNPDVRDAQCFFKCRRGSCRNKAEAPCYCDGYDRKQDRANSKTLCVSKEVAVGLCNSLPACRAIAQLAHEHRFALLDSSCEEKTAWAKGFGVTGATGVGYNIWVKTFADTQGCLLGAGVELTGGRYPQLEGLYASTVSDPQTLTYVQLAGRSRIRWWTNRCGWVVEDGAEQVIAPAKECEDSDAVVALLFGEEDATCAQGAAFGAFCENVLFAAVCASSCGRRAGGQGKCGEDRPDAAAALGNLRVVADTNVTVRFVFRSRLQIRERLFT
jgi:hypothetical protein